MSVRVVKTVCGLCGYVLPEKTIDRLVEMVWNLEEVDSVSQLVDLL